MKHTVTSARRSRSSCATSAGCRVTQSQKPRLRRHECYTVFILINNLRRRRITTNLMGGTMGKIKSNRSTTKALQRYAASYIAAKAHEAIMAYTKEAAIAELNLAGGTAIVDDVEFCLKQISTQKYGADVQAIIENLEAQIEEQKKRAEEAGKVKVSYKETLAAKIPKSNTEAVLARVREYANYFGQR